MRTANKPSLTRPPDRSARPRRRLDILDVDVGGLWLVDNYRGNFVEEIDHGGMDGPIGKRAERNKAVAHG
ncbi:MAG: hypothetical protein ABI277_11440 [Burkholderiaceae bacterium]